MRRAGDIVLSALILAFAALPCWAQGGAALNERTRSPESQESQRTGRVPMRNKVNVTVIEHLNEAHRYTRTRQVGGRILVQDGQGNEFGYDHYRVFRPLPRAETTFPQFSLSGMGTSQKIIGGREFITSLRDIGDPLSPPPITKPTPPGGDPSKSTLFGTDSDRNEDSDSTVLYGPELTLPVKGDVTEWEIAEWLPAQTTMNLYAKALFGEFELFGRQSDLELYGVGVGLGIPVWSPGDFRLRAGVGLGPGFLKTDLGDAVGLDAQAGLTAELPLAGNLAFVASAKFTLFAAENVSSWGPALNLGLVFVW